MENKRKADEISKGVPELKEGQYYLLVTPLENGDEIMYFYTQNQEWANRLVYPEEGEDGYPVLECDDLLGIEGITELKTAEEVDEFTGNHWCIVLEFQNWC